MCVSVCMCAFKTAGGFQQHSAIQVVLGRRDLGPLWTGRLSGFSTLSESQSK